MPGETSAQETSQAATNEERREILRRLEDWLEGPMVALAFVWLILLVVEFVHGQSRWMDALGTLIWIIFIIDFIVRFSVSPEKLSYLRGNWLTLLSLVVPAFRVFRLFTVLRFARIAQVGRGLRLIRVVSSVNRGMRALGATMKRRGFGYVVLLTSIVTLAGAAGMYAFEREIPNERGLHSFGAALWWTAMIITTMGSEYWPRTSEGRLLCFLLSVYAFAVFGYVTATIASFFIGRDADNKEGELAGQSSIDELRAEITALRSELKDSRRSEPQ